MTSALAIATGIAALLAALMRLGFLASFISEPVIKGFSVGLALTIIIGQVPKLLGIEKGSGDFFETAWDVITHVGEVDGLTLG
jgi:MFS superfamily sulfate permease-like transporter